MIYTPSRLAARTEYVASRSQIVGHAGALAEWSRFMNGIQHAAYREGYTDAQHDEHEHRPGRKSVPPYLPEGTP